MNQTTGLFVLFVGHNTKRDKLRDIIIAFSGEQGLTSKLEGKATVKSATAGLTVEMKIGFNDEKQRMIHIINVVDSLGGDKSGKKFAEFCQGLAWKLAKLELLREQESIDQTVANQDTQSENPKEVKK